MLVLKEGVYEGPGNMNLISPAVQNLTICSERGERSRTVVNLSSVSENGGPVTFIRMSATTLSLTVYGITFTHFCLPYLDARYQNASVIDSPYDAECVNITRCAFHVATARLVYLSPEVRSFVLRDVQFRNISIFGSRFQLLKPSLKIGDQHVIGNVTTFVEIDSIDSTNLDLPVPNDGPFLYASGAVNLTIRNSLFYHTKARFAHVFLEPIFTEFSTLAPQLTVENCTFDSLSARVIGRPSASAFEIRSCNASLLVNNCTFSNNQHSQAVNLLFLHPSSVTFTQCNFTNNCHDTEDDIVEAGAMYLLEKVGNSLLKVERSTFFNNTAPNDGGAVSCKMKDFSSTAHFYDCEMHANSAAQDGGHIFVLNGNFTVSSCNLTGGGATKGGAISLVDSVLRMEHTSMCHNDAPMGGSFYCANSRVTVDQNSSFGHDGHGTVFCYYCDLSGSTACTFWSPLTILTVVLFIVALLVFFAIALLIRYFKKKRSRELNYTLINET